MKHNEKADQRDLSRFKLGLKMATESEPEPVMFVFREKTEHNLEHLMSVLGRSEVTAV